MGGMRGPVGRSGQGTACRRRDPGHPATYAGAPSQLRRMESATAHAGRARASPRFAAARRRAGAMAVARPRRARRRRGGRLLRLRRPIPNYDSYYSLLWGREVLHGHLPSFEAYRAPTEHPLAVAFGAVLSLLGDDADRVMVAAARCVVRRAGRRHLPARAGVASRRSSALVAAALLVHALRLPVPRGARPTSTSRSWRSIVWAGALEAARPRRGHARVPAARRRGPAAPGGVAAAGLYFLWMSWHATWRAAVRYAALTAIGAGRLGRDRLRSSPATRCSRCTHTTGLAEELGRTRGPVGDPGRDAPSSCANLDKTPVFFAGIVGLALAIVARPAARRDAAVLFLDRRSSRSCSSASPGCR